MSTVITLCHPLPVLLVPQSPPVAMAQLQRGVFLSRGGGRYGNPPSNTPRGGIYYFRQPPIGVVVGAGAVGALTGHLVFHSLLISVGLGAGIMGIAANSDNQAGDVARSAGRMALAAFDGAIDLDERYHFTNRLAETAEMARAKLKEVDRDHALVHRATEGAKRTWRGIKQYDDAHRITSRAGNALGSGFDKMAEAFTLSENHAQPTKNTRGYSSGRAKNSASTNRGGARGGGALGGSRSGGSWDFHHKKGVAERGGKKDDAGGRNGRAYAGVSDEDGWFELQQQREREELAKSRGEVNEQGGGEGEEDAWWGDDDSEYML